MDTQTWEHVVEKHATTFGERIGTCMLCKIVGRVMFHVSRLGVKEYWFCESCAERVWSKGKPQA